MWNTAVVVKFFPMNGRHSCSVVAQDPFFFVMFSTVLFCIFRNSLFTRTPNSGNKMFHVEQKTTSIFKNSLSFGRLHAILTIVNENGKFGICSNLHHGKILQS